MLRFYYKALCVTEKLTRQKLEGRLNIEAEINTNKDNRTWGVI